MFSQVELFLEIYERDETIERASVTLISTVFYAIECVIGFFISSTCTSLPSAAIYNQSDFEEWLG